MSIETMERATRRLLADAIRARAYPDALIPGERVHVPQSLAPSVLDADNAYVTGVRLIGDYSRLVQFIADTLASIPGGYGGAGGYNAPLVLARLAGTVLVPGRGYLPGTWSADTDAWTLTDCAYWSAVRTRAYLDAINQAIDQRGVDALNDTRAYVRAVQGEHGAPHDSAPVLHAVRAAIAHYLDVDARDHGPVETERARAALMSLDARAALADALAYLDGITGETYQNARPDIDQALETAADHAR